jgi:hypothetical protein
MTMRFVTSAFLVLMIFGCSKDHSVVPIEPADEISDAEYSVLAAIVDSVIIGPSSPTLVVYDSTSCGVFSSAVDSALTSLLQRIGQHITALKAETILDFKAKNLTRSCVVNPKKIDPRCVLSSATTVAYPMLSVSRVGFSIDGQQALAYVGCVYAPLAGSGVYYVLSREGEKWKIIGGEMIWIS